MESHANEALTAIDVAVKIVQDKASDVTVEDRTDTMPTDSADSASSQEACHGCTAQRRESRPPVYDQ